MFLTFFWVSGTFSFVIQEATNERCEAVRLPLNALCQFGMIALGLWTLRHRCDIAIIAVVSVLTYVSTCIVNAESTVTWLNGMRRYWAFMFIIPTIRYLWGDSERRGRFVKSFDKTLYVFLVIQAPCLCFQAVFHGMGDLGGGSLGWYNSGIVSHIIYLVSFYLMVRRWNTERGYFGNLGDNWVLLALLAPSMLNETKVSFIFLLLYFLFLLPFDRYFVRRLLVVIPMTVVIMSGALWWYVSKIDRDGEILEADFIDNYVLGANMIDLAFDLLDRDVDTDDVWESDYARGIKYALIPTLLERGGSDKEIWGYGVGQFKGGHGLDKTAFAKQYEWILRGTQTEVFDAAVELGYTGVGALFLYLFVIFRAFRRVGRANRNRRFTWWMAANILITISYTVGFDSVPFSCIAIFMIFISSRWSQLPPYEKYSILFPDKTAGTSAAKTAIAQ